ncbi:site-specific integrase [Christensenellaceae bacterium OttesenSCG-928-L17]|nr:site-specific integrase [Christensenellaceae bacterium OttesenSCG-928-L17]
MPPKKPIKEKADKRYRAKITVGHDVDGKPIYKYASGRTRKELADNEKELKASYIGGEKIERDVTFERFAEDWFETYKKGRFSASTDQSYSGVIRKHLAPVLGSRQVRAITKMDLQKLLNSKTGLSCTTIGYIDNAIKQIFQAAFSQGIIDRDPSIGLSKPEAEKLQRRALTEAEVAATLKVSETHPHGIMLAILYYTGIRRGEMLGLQWRDVDFKDEKISIRRDIDFKTGKIGGLKSRKSQRDIPMPPELIATLEPIRGIGDTFVIQGRDGNFMGNGAFAKAWKDLMCELCLADKEIENKEGISVLTAHYYRHNYATILYDAGVDILAASKWLGHASINTTLDIYTHLSDGKEACQAALIKNVFQKVAKRLPEAKTEHPKNP